MIVRRALDGDIRVVFGALAPERAAEMTATAFHDDPRRLAEELIAVRDFRRGSLTEATLFALSVEPQFPMAIVGVVPLGPAYGAMIWAAVPRWPVMAVASHSWWRTAFIPEILQKTYRRVEFTALAGDTASRRWLKTLGFTEEGTAYRQGKCGEDFVHCAWLNPDQSIGVQNARS